MNEGGFTTEIVTILLHCKQKETKQIFKLPMPG